MGHVGEAERLIAAFERWELGPELLESTLALSKQELDSWIKGKVTFTGSIQALGAWLSLDFKLALVYPSPSLEREWWRKPSEAFGGLSPEAFASGGESELLWVNYCVDGFLQFRDTQDTKRMEDRSK